MGAIWVGMPCWPASKPPGAPPPGWPPPWLIPIAVAISPVTQLQASGVNGVVEENDDAVSRIAVFGSMPWSTCWRRLSARPASAAATRMLFSRGASGSRSLRRFDIVCGLDSAGTPCSGSVTMALSAARASAACSHDMSVNPTPLRMASSLTSEDAH